MNGKEAIIEKILSDAREKAKEITDRSLYEKAMSEKATKEWVDKYISSQRAELKKDCKDLIERRKTLAELDRRKLILQAKQDIIGDVIEKTYAKLCALKKEDYLKFVLALIGRYAENGDKIILSSDRVLSVSDLEGSTVVKEKGLTISKEVGAFKGGVFLEGKLSDKDLTFRAMLEEEKEGLSAKITAELFD